MKSVKQNQELLLLLKKYAGTKIWKGIVENCNASVIRALAEILHNVLIGNLPLDVATVVKLSKYKTQLKRLHSCIRRKKLVGHRRKKFANQKGGFWPIIINAALSALASYAGEKLAENG